MWIVRKSTKFAKVKSWENFVPHSVVMEILWLFSCTFGVDLVLLCDAWHPQESNFLFLRALTEIFSLFLGAGGSDN